MRTTHIYMLWLCLYSFFGIPLNAQNNTCGPEEVISPNDFKGTTFFNYGSTARSKSLTYKTAYAIGQTFVGYTEKVDTNSWLGFYSRYFLPPFALKVKATQGELLDRIQVNWEIDALGPSPNEGFNIYRDDIFLAKVSSNIRSYNDFNVIPGQPYTYCVRGVNIFGEGVKSCALGFQVPNGTVTGWVSTLNGSPVPDASVTLTPMQGFSAKFKDGDGAFVLTDTLNPFLPDMGEDWTITFWIKIDIHGATTGKLIGMPGLYIRTRPGNTGNEGIAVAATPDGTAILASNFPVATKNDWHHVALTYDGNSSKGRLYFDGALVAIAAMNSIASPDTLKLGELAASGLWVGRLDELRIYHHKLDELDFDYVMVATASSETQYLTHYWKMDEELGVKSYDIVHRHILYFCGAEDNAWFDPDRPPVHTAGITNEDGYYKIESASYGTGTTFLATPKKNFYLHRSLKFEKADNDYATLPDFPITNKATIETWVNSAGVDGFQSILSKKWGSNEFRIMLSPSGTDYQIRVYLNATVHDYGLLGSGFQHLAFTWDNASHKVFAFKNGVSLGSFTFPAVTGNWSDSDPSKTWYLGNLSDGTLPYGGLIDEVAFYDTTLSTATILSHFQNSRNVHEKGLRVYFPLDEGSGTNLSNVGSLLMGGGTTFGTEWSALAAHQIIEPHVFSPSTRQVTLNPSVTSVDQIDFIDRSTIGVTGYVRYKNTDCFANNIEILVNGQSFNPQIFTDTTGKFVIDFDPGTSATLTPKFEGHTFEPAFWQVTNVSSPIAGIVFNDITTRKLSVKVAGGECSRSLTTGGLTCVVRVRSGDNCLSQDNTVPVGQTNILFDNLPPMQGLTVAVVEHSYQVIKDAFDAQGGVTVDLSKKNDTISFVYIAPPIVDIINGITTQCNPPVIVWDQDEHVDLQIKLKEQYPGGFCEIDTASFHIINDVADEVVDTTMGNSLFEYEFTVGGPNPTPPYKKTIQFIAKTLAGVESSTIKEAIVTGIKSNLATFTSMMPEIPTLILRDPPGDGSSSFLQKGEKICKTTEITSELENGLGGSLDVDYAPSITLVVAPVGIGTIAVLDPSIGNNLEGQVTFKQLTSNSFETCMSVDEKVSTSSGDLVVGEDADLYMGNAFNVIFGLADKVEFNNCTATVEQVVQVQSGGVATTFIYSRFNIENNIIRYLHDLAEDSQTSDADSILYEESIEMWLAILEKNEKLKDSSEFIRNISFDAGANYDYSETSSTSGENSNEHGIDGDVSNTTRFGIHFEDAGITGSIKFVTKTSNSTNESTGEEQGITTGYSLEDDDPLDQFTVDVKMDNVYKTPVFKTVSGQSSCPYEENTANREAPNLKLAPGFPFVATNVPANEPAIFELILGNQSATHEDWTYGLTAIAARNPYGAVIKLNGASLTGGMQKFIIPYGDSIRVTITIERGPIEYTYDSLVVALVSECEYEHNLALSLPLNNDPRFFSSLKLGAHFIRPCSEVNIIVPQQEEWVIKNNNPLKITASGYNLDEPNFELLRLQYRPTGGDGAWINIEDIYNPNWSMYNSTTHGTDTLTPVFHDIFWSTTGKADGQYEIRALTVCLNAIPNNNGYSKILKGRIDRLPPSIVGVPQPSDGVLQQGDEISFTFNQPINCDKLNPLNDVRLVYSATGQPITKAITCVDNKIVINPLVQNSFLENQYLKVILDTIEDLTGNKFIGIDPLHNNPGIWEFYVDRNELEWLTDSAGITKYEDERKSTTVKIHNRGGYPVDFRIDSVPNWVHVTPNAGTLRPNEIEDIEITAEDTLANGWLSDHIVLYTVPGLNPNYMGENENLPIGVRTICRPPDWQVDPSQYQLTMTLITRLSFNNGVSNSTDPEDIVAAFIDGEVRGVAKLVQNPAANNYVAFLTIYGDNADIGKLVTYEIFDASACARYEGKFSNSAFTYTANGTQGSPTNSRLLSNGALVDDIPLNKGWNWLSFNLGFAHSTIDSVLNQIPNPAGDLIKDKTTFSMYNHNTWSGSLSNITNTSMYMYQANQPNTMRMTGTALVPASVPITVGAGWNWIGYIPTYKLTVNQALASLSGDVETGDIIKSQNAFAQYVNSTVGWVGNLKKLEPPQGYLLRLSNDGILTYPVSSFTSDDHFSSRDAESTSTFWNVNASQYENNMTLIGIFEFEQANATTDDMELGAFVGDELRGVGEAVYIDYLDAYLFFMTCFANNSGEQLHFKLYDAKTGVIQNLYEKMIFLPNDNQGRIEDPVPFTLQTTGIGDVDSELSFNVQPNPFCDETVCRMELPDAQQVHLIITDMQGRNVFYTSIQANTGMNSFVWKGCTTSGIPLSKGIYFIRMETKQGILTKKVVLQR